ncbi:MAG: hypothetical protein AAFR61_07775 [Bacteroidota bacterium]
MIFLLLWLVGLSIQPPAPLPADETLKTSDQVTVYVFLHESCVISQYYTLPLRRLHNKYADENLRFIGLFPNASSQPQKMQAFKAAYKLPFDLQTDHDHARKEAFGATVTPEVVVFNESQGKILYQGRIDDSYARVGKRRRVSTTSELADVLHALAKNKPIEVANTQPIGCFISKKNPN